MNGLNVKLVSAKIVFGVGENLTLYLSKGGMNVAGYDRCVVDQV
jgi:hypothetical protein